MPQVINTNIPSLNAQRNLNASQNAMSTSLERLSSGLRINSAKDDAAGLAISDRMTAQINGLDQATRNANDGISLAQTAESGLTAVGDNLQRIRQLAVQSANATNSSSDRASLNAEVGQLLAEIQRVSTTTQFNGQNILSGTFASAQFQVGANANQTIIASTGNSQTSAIGAYQFNNTTTAVTGASLAAGDVTINGVDIGATPATVYSYATDIATAINNQTSVTGVSATAVSTMAAPATNVPSRKQDLASGDLVINGINIGAVTGSFSVSSQGSSIAAAINLKTAQTGVSATANISTGALTLASATGQTIAVTTSNGATGADHIENATGLEVSAGAAVATGDATFTGTKGVTSVAFTAVAVAGDKVTVNGQTYTFAAVAVGNTTVAYGADKDASATNLFNAINLNEASLNTGRRITASNATAGTTTITSDYATKDTGHTTITEVDPTNNMTINNAVTAGVGVGAGDTLTLGGVTYSFGYANTAAVSGTTAVTIGGTATLTATAFAAAINNKNAGVLTNISATSNLGVVSLTSQNKGAQGTLDVVDTNAVPVGVSFGNAAGGTVGTYSANTVQGIISLSSDTAYSVAGNNTSKAGLQNATSTLNTVSAVDISTVTGSNAAISIVDGAISQIDTIRGNMGALQNRFTSVVSSLSATSVNLSAARSRIRDADFAAETANMTRNSILQQAGTAMLAQANSLPQNVLTLLR